MHSGTRDSALARHEWRSGWPVVLASAAGMSVGPIMTYTMGIFVEPLEAEFGWSRAFIATGLTVNAAIAVVFAVVVGALVDRLGPRRIAIPGVILFFLCFGLLSTATGSHIQWWALWFAISVGALTLKPTVWTWAIISRFKEARGLAMALALSGTAITGIIAPFLAEYFIQNFGWRWAYIGLSFAYFIVVVPLITAFFYGSNDLLRSGVKGAEPREAERTGLSVKQALISVTYWKLALGTFMIMLTIIGCVVHFVPILTHGGLARGGAVAAAGAMGVAAIAGRLLAGVLLDRIDAKLVGGFAFLLPATVCMALTAFAGDMAVAIGIALMLGLCTGAEIEVSSYLSSKHFGLRNFGTLFGIIAGLIAFANGVAPVLAGHSFDVTGSYDMALIVGLVLSIGASLMIFTLADYPTEFESPS